MLTTNYTITHVKVNCGLQCSHRRWSYDWCGLDCERYIAAHIPYVMMSDGESIVVIFELY